MTTRLCAVCTCLLDSATPGNTCPDCADDFGDCDNVDGRDESHDDQDADDGEDTTDADRCYPQPRAIHRHHPDDGILLDDPEALDADDCDPSDADATTDVDLG